MEGKVEYLEMKPSANGGFIISYSHCTKPDGSGMYGNMSSKSCTEVFNSKEGKKAFDRFTELAEYVAGGMMEDGESEKKSDD